MKKLLLALLVLLGLQTKAQINFCDSISYTTTSTIKLSIWSSGNSKHSRYNVTWNWTVCNSNICYSSSGQWAYFPQVSVN